MGKFTRVDYFLKFLREIEMFDIDELRAIFPESYEFMYSTYDILKKENIQSSDILSANYDAERLSIGIEFNGKSLAKKFKNIKNEGIQGCINSLQYSTKVERNIVFFNFDYIRDDDNNY